MNSTGPDLPDVAGFLESLRARKVWFHAPAGNHGDRLILLGAERLLDAAGIQRVAQPQAAEFHLFNGGGWLAAPWSGLDRLAAHARRFPATPLAVLPCSWHPPAAGLSLDLSARTAPIWLWARDRTSLELLRQWQPACEMRIGLDHDLAFHLAGSNLLRDLPSPSGEGYLLVVERDDWEGVTGRRRPLKITGLEWIPERIRNAVRRPLVAMARRRQDQDSRLLLAAREFLAEMQPELAGLPARCQDVSLAEANSFQDMLQTVAGATCIVTTRLHVAILGHLLGRTTFLVDGAYHKFRGVHEYSMQTGNTRMLTYTNGHLAWAPAAQGPA